MFGRREEGDIEYIHQSSHEKTVKIGQINNQGMDEIYTRFYSCPQCWKVYIIKSFKFCPICGVGLEWEDD